MDVESADSASRNSATSARKSFDSRSRISAVAAGISSFSFPRRVLSTCNQPRAVLLVRTTVGVARAAQQRGIQLVQFRAPSERIQPDVLVALAFVQRPYSQTALEKETERTLRGLLQLRDRQGRVGCSRIERHSCAGHVPIELSKLNGFPPFLRRAAVRDAGERGAKGLDPFVASADDGAQPPST